MTNKNNRSLRTLDLSALDAVAGGTGLSGILNFSVNHFSGVGGVGGVNGAPGAPGASDAPSGIQTAPEIPSAANDGDWGAFELPGVDIGSGWDATDLADLQSELGGGLVPAGGGSFVTDFHSSEGGNTISIHQESSSLDGNHIVINGQTI